MNFDRHHETSCREIDNVPVITIQAGKMTRPNLQRKERNNKRQPLSSDNN